MIKNKTLRPAEDIVADLLILKEELWQKHKHTPVNTEAKWIALKINSCLFSGYPKKVV